VEGAPGVVPGGLQPGRGRSYFDEGIRVWQRLAVRIEPDTAAREAKPKRRRVSDEGSGTALISPIPPTI